MRRVRIVLVAALAASATSVVLVANGSGQTTGARTLTFFEPTTGSTFQFVDLPPKSTKTNPLSIGDEVIFSNPILNGRGGARVGTAHAEGTFVQGHSPSNGLILGRGVFKLRNGELVVQGLFRSSDKAHTDTVAVIGGTGAYEGARGQFTSRTNADGSSQDTVQLLP